MKCPFCDTIDTQVKDSRPLEEGTSIKRRRLCPKCDARFVTIEQIQRREIKVIKRNGDIRHFDINKLIKSIEVAVRKRPIPIESVEKISHDIIKKLEKLGEPQILSSVIGTLVMEELAKLDEIAYIRYASVYKDFNTATDFVKFIASLNE